MDLSVVVVTSPSKSNPAITLVEQVLDSVDNIEGLEDAAIIIVMDGFEVFGKQINPHLLRLKKCVMCRFLRVMI